MSSNPLFIVPDFSLHFPKELSYAEKNVVFHIGVRRNVSFPQKPVVKCVRSDSLITLLIRKIFKVENKVFTPIVF